mgnify:CR=1 FL=1
MILALKRPVGRPVSGSSRHVAIRAIDPRPASPQKIDRHPRINRFVAGGRLYERDGVWISFTAKTELSDAQIDEISAYITATALAAR